MAQGYSLHLGLNGVDAAKYNGWAGTLAGCVNDANAMQSICAAQGFTTQVLLNEQATSDAILGGIGQAAYNLQPGDTFVLSYSGHGGQVPDTTGDSPNGLDDTWVAYDRMVLGHELYNLWSQFAAGVKIEVYSDSCHSGTVVRELVTPDGLIKWPRNPGSGAARGGGATALASTAELSFRQVYAAASAALRVDAAGIGNPSLSASPSRSIPPALALQLFARDRSHYDAAMWSRNRAAISAAVILISGCQDNQESQDGVNNGLFTEKLLAVWNNGNFAGTLPQFHQAILALMPPTQTPNYFTVGADDPVFDAARPLSLVVDRGTSLPAEPPVDATVEPPKVTGPGRMDPTSSPPTFTVIAGSNRFWTVEIASDPEAFGDTGRRTASGWYASWDDPNLPPRMTGTTFQLPASAWNRLRDSSRLYYRVGSTANSTGWDRYLVSTTDGDAASAPYIALSSIPKNAKGVPPDVMAVNNIPFGAYSLTY